MALLIALLVKDQNVAFLATLAIAVAASANLPALLFTMYFRRTTAAGVTWGMVAGLVAAVAMILMSPVLHPENPEAALIPQIECTLGVQNAAQIAAVPGIDHLFLGTADLAASTGLAPSDPAFGQLMATVADAATNAGVALGTAIGAVPGAPMPEALTSCRFWAVSNDAGLLLQGSRSALAVEEVAQH